MRCLATTKDLSKDRAGAMDQAWHRARARIDRRQVINRLTGTYTGCQRELHMEIEKLKEDQKNMFNQQQGYICKTNLAIMRR